MGGRRVYARTSYYEVLEERIKPHVPTFAAVIATMNVLDVSCDKLWAKDVFTKLQKILPPLLFGRCKIKFYGTRCVFSYPWQNASDRRARVEALYERVRVYAAKEQARAKKQELIVKLGEVVHAPQS
jgi:hypothetical protein